MSRRVCVVCVVCSEEFACSAHFHGRNPKCGGCRRMRPVVIAGIALAPCERRPIFALLAWIDASYVCEAIMSRSVRTF